MLAFALFAALPVLAMTLHEGDPQVRRALGKFIESGELPAGVSIRGEGDDFYIECFGGTRPTDLFWIASMTKGVTGCAIARLASEGRLSLDDKASKYLAEFDSDRLRDITIRQLMSHTAGIASDGQLKRLAANRGDLRIASLDDIVREFAAEPAAIASLPGAKYEYSTVGIDLCGAVIEKVTGMKFGEYLKKTFFAPLGMNDTTFSPDPSNLVPVWKLAKGEKAVQVSRPELAIGTYESGGGGLYSTPQDVLRFYRMLMEGGSLDGRVYLDEKAMSMLSAKQTPDAVKTAYSLGMFVKGGGWIGHGGMYQTYGEYNCEKHRLRLYFGQYCSGSGDWYDAWHKASEAQHRCVADKPAPMSEDPKHWWWRSLAYRDAEAEKLHDADVVWLGDSITHYFDMPGAKNDLWKKYFGGKDAGAPYLGLNFGIEGDTTENLLYRMKKSLGKTSPRAIILNIGTNNTGIRNEMNEPPEDTIAGLKAVMDEIRTGQPQAKVFVYAIFPRGKGRTDPCTIRNEKVNEGLAKLCDGKQFVFCDIREKMLNPDGTIDVTQLEDRLHPAAKGYETWLADVLPRLEKVFAEGDSADSESPNP